jgi:death-on-curing protein
MKCSRSIASCCSASAGLKVYAIPACWRAPCIGPAPVTLAEMGAPLFESLIMNHPFLDGNKRVAFFATDVFLRLNGYQLKVDAKKAHRFLIDLLENDRCNFDELLPWIRKHALKL